MAQINPQQMLPMGTILDGRYRILRYLASGGFGNTYIAEHINLGDKVAIKEFFMRGTNHRSIDGTTVEVSNDENTTVFNSQLKKFRREAKRIFKLHNDHIIHVSDLFDSNGTSYYVMDLVEGTSLNEQIRQNPLPEHEALDVITQVLDALQTMHAAGLYHLDVKPGNIMRDKNGHCTLIDFGASKQLSADDHATFSSSAMAYTPGYAPLEQVQQLSKTIGPWTDFYALGATLYKLLTGCQPPMVEADDIAPNGRQFDYPIAVRAHLRHAISALMNPARRLRPQNADQVRALLNNIPEETIYTTPSPSPKEEKTQFSSSPVIPPQSIPSTIDPEPSSKNRFWYVIAGAAAIIAFLFIIMQLTKGVEKPLTSPPTEEEFIAEINYTDSLNAALEAWDASKIEQFLNDIKEKVAGIDAIKYAPQLEAVQNWLKENIDKVKEVLGEKYIAIVAPVANFDISTIRDTDALDEVKEAAEIYDAVDEVIEAAEDTWYNSPAPDTPDDYYLDAAEKAVEDAKAAAEKAVKDMKNAPENLKEASKVANNPSEMRPVIPEE